RPSTSASAVLIWSSVYGAGGGPSGTLSPYASASSRGSNQPSVWSITASAVICADTISLPMRSPRSAGQPGEQLAPALVRVAHPAFHVGGRHRVPVLDRLEGGHRAHQRGAAPVLERPGVQRHVAGRALVLEGLHHTVRRRGAVEHAVEAVLVA